MKTLIAAFTSLAMLTTPALAQEHRESSEHYRYEVRPSNNWIAPLVGGAILGGILAEGQHYYRSNLVCENYYVRDAYGNYVLDSFGRAILQQRCWYTR